jgi:hypothetical protein
MPVQKTMGGKRIVAVPQYLFDDFVAVWQASITGAAGVERGVPLDMETPDVVSVGRSTHKMTATDIASRP